MDEMIDTEVSSLRFAALRNILYHNSRRAAFARWDRLMNFVTIVAGTAVATQALQFFEFSDRAATLLFGGLTTVVGALALVYRFNDVAHHHARMAEKYTDILAVVDGTVTFDQQTIADLKRQFAVVAGTELPMYRAAQAVAQNEAYQALYGDAAPVLEVSFFQWLFRNVLPFNGKVFREIPAVKGDRAPV